MKDGVFHRQPDVARRAATCRRRVASPDRRWPASSISSSRIAVDVEPATAASAVLLHPWPGRHLEHAGRRCCRRCPAHRTCARPAGLGPVATGSRARSSIDGFVEACRRVLASCRRGARPRASAIRSAPSSPPIWPRASPGSSAAWRCSARCWRRPTRRGPAIAARAAQGARRGRRRHAGDRRRAARRRRPSAETKAAASRGRGLVREIADAPAPDGYARTCDALAEAGPADASAIACPTCS